MHVATEIAELNPNAAALPVDDPRRAGFGRLPGSPSRRIICLRLLAVGRIGNLCQLAAAQLIAPRHPARLAGKGIERGHRLPLPFGSRACFQAVAGWPLVLVARRAASQSSRSRVSYTMTLPSLMNGGPSPVSRFFSSVLSA